MSLAQATGVHNIDNCVDLVEHWGRSAEAARAIGVLGGASSCST